MNYVCGLIFSADRARILLIEKRRPAWQAGRLNGIGGKIEDGETPAAAMARELAEEAALALAPDAFWPVAVLDGDGFRVHFFAATADIDTARALTDEPLVVVPVADLQGLPLLTPDRT